MFYIDDGGDDEGDDDDEGKEDDDDDGYYYYYLYIFIISHREVAYQLRFIGDNINNRLTTHRFLIHFVYFFLLVFFGYFDLFFHFLLLCSPTL